MAKRSKPKVKRARGRRRAHELRGDVAAESAAPSNDADSSGAKPSNDAELRDEPKPKKKVREPERNSAALPSSSDLPPPLLTLEELPDRMRRCMLSQALAAPTNIQAQCWPVVLGGHDLVCVAPTGCGKTLAYALPLAELAQRWPAPRGGAPRALFLLPTRELAQQVATACEPLLRVCDVRTAAVHGGVHRRAQIDELRALRPPPLALAATPGRLGDLCGLATPGAAAAEAALDLGGVRLLVLDEVDKMLQMGLWQQVEQLVALVDAGAGGGDDDGVRRQTIVVSATLPAELGARTAELCRAPRHVTIAQREAAPLTVPAGVAQHVWVVAEHKKPRRMLRLLEKVQGAERRVLIFANKIKAVHFVAELLGRHGIAAEALTSQRSQPEREACLRRFRAAEVQVLVATDVAARGLQIDGLRYVLNWDFGSNLAQYVHRVGRTGRQGAGGTAWSFFTRNLRPLAADAVRLLRAHAQPVDPYLLQLVGGVDGAEGDEDDGGGGDDDDDDDAAAAAPAAAPPRKRKRSAAAAEAPPAAGGGALRWLAKKMASPITGQLGTFGSGMETRAADEGEDSD